MAHVRLHLEVVVHERQPRTQPLGLRFALTLEPDFPQLHEDLGSALAMQSRYDEAIPAFEKAIQPGSKWTALTQF